mmetsp:Transcript_33208/g.71722  ORF Transcript_33208/g.71722 Transcript_33208/m.71722 type:complete len:81 (-) Transcript_33208:10-252(-)
MPSQNRVSRSTAPPDIGRVPATAEVVCHSNSVLKIQNGMPPPRWHENHVAGALDELDRSLSRRPELRALLKTPPPQQEPA